MPLKPVQERILRGCRLFATLDENDFKVLTRDHRVVELVVGQPLFEQGSPAEAFFVVLEGWVVLFRDQANGNRVVIHLVGPGESFAEALLSADDVLYPASAEAASRLRVARFEIRTYRQHISQSPRLALAVIAATFRQLRGLVDQIEHNNEWSSRRRIANFLLRMCRTEEGPRGSGRPPSNPPDGTWRSSAVSASASSRPFRSLGSFIPGAVFRFPGQLSSPSRF